ncbi:MAG: sporulation protein YunB [Oscillospiraceae bacterium]|nr:sporulation protein YunB [Oscillospiraceae bacterium]
MWKRKLDRFLRRLQVRFRHMPKGKYILTKVLVVLLVLTAAFAVIMAELEPALEKMAAIMISNDVTEYLNDAVAETVKDGEFRYGDLVTIERDSNGDVAAISSNMARINLLQTEIASYVMEKLSDRMKTSIKIPFGNLVGGTIMSGRGPDIPVRILSVSNFYTDFSNDFTEAGINQTRHRIIIDFEVEIDMLIPGGTVRESIDASVVVAETVIVGDVPNTFTEFSAR